jgi:3',5'-cyclic AMP phosphodiesterase CpdA
MRLVQISDTHFGTERGAVVGALHAAITRLDPQVVALCGDITQRARRGQFEAARRFMEALPRHAVQIAIPGNHDIPVFNLWARIRHPYANYENAFRTREALWSGEGVTVLALDATSPRRHANGELPSAALRKHLANATASRSPHGVLIVAAHQPLWTAWKPDRSETLIGRDETAQILAGARIDMILSGHVHVPIIGTSATIDAALPWHFVLSGSGTAVSHRTRKGVPNSFNVVDVEGDRITVAQHNYGLAGFEPAKTRFFQRGPAGWSASEPSLQK